MMVVTKRQLQTELRALASRRGSRYFILYVQ